MAKEKVKTGKEMKRRVLALAKAGKSNAEILAALGIGRTTLVTLKEELRGEGKLPAYDRGAAAKAAWARRRGEETEKQPDTPEAPKDGDKGADDVGYLCFGKHPFARDYQVTILEKGYDLLGTIKGLRFVCACFCQKELMVKCADAERKLMEAIKVVTGK